MSPPEAGWLVAAAGAVVEPEIGRPLAELGMLGAVRAERDGTVRVEVRLSRAACPHVEQLRADVERALTAGAGVRRVLTEFVTMTEPQRLALATQLRGHMRPTEPAERIYAVASGKGGVGKSTVAANLAVSLADRGLRVGLLDADVWGCSVPQLFGVHRAPVALKGLMLPIEAYGVRLMSVGFLVEPDAPVVWRGPMLHKALEQFCTDVYWGELDVLVLDLPPGTGDVTLSLLELLPSAALLAVTTPQPAAQQVAARVGRMARDLRMPVAGVVENMSAAVCAHCGAHTALFGAGGGERLAEAIDAPLLARIPLDVEVREAGDAGRPVVRARPEGAAARAIGGLAADLPTVRRSLVGVPLSLSVV